MLTIAANSLLMTFELGEQDSARMTPQTGLFASSRATFAGNLPKNRQTTPALRLLSWVWTGNRTKNVKGPKTAGIPAKLGRLSTKREVGTGSSSADCALAATPASCLEQTASAEQTAPFRLEYSGLGIPATFEFTMPSADQPPNVPSHDEFMRLFSQHSRRIYQFILMLTMNHADADEVYQNTCVVLWKKFGSYDPMGAYYAWACRIAQLEMLQVRRTNRRMQIMSDDVLNLLADQGIAYGDRAAERQDALSECLNRLKSDDRQLVEERYYHERAPKEIASQQSRSVHSVYRALARIHMSLRECVHRTIAREHAR